MGMGIHGEPGIWRDTLKPRRCHRRRDGRPAAGRHAGRSGRTRVSVLVNSLGATPLEELFILYRRPKHRLAEGRHRRSSCRWSAATRRRWRWRARRSASASSMTKSSGCSLLRAIARSGRSADGHRRAEIDRCGNGARWHTAMASAEQPSTPPTPSLATATRAACLLASPSASRPRLTCGDCGPRRRVDALARPATAATGSSLGHAVGHGALTLGEATKGRTTIHPTELGASRRQARDAMITRGQARARRQDGARRARCDRRGTSGRPIGDAGVVGRRRGCFAGPAGVPHPPQPHRQGPHVRGPDDRPGRPRHACSDRTDSRPCRLTNDVNRQNSRQVLTS